MQEQMSILQDAMQVLLAKPSETPQIVKPTSQKHPKERDLLTKAIHVPPLPPAATLTPVYSQVPLTNTLGGVAFSSSIIQSVV